MARTLEELIVIKRTALRYLVARESKLLAQGKRPVNKKIANFVKTHQESNVWSNFMDSLNDDLTKNLNVFSWKLEDKVDVLLGRRQELLEAKCVPVTPQYTMPFRVGRMSESPVVEVTQGALQGRAVEGAAGKTFYSFQGVPYARAPLGSLRFKAPQPPEPWEGVRDATSEGNESAQIDPLIQHQYIGDENCLFLNVYTPNLDGEFLPVMVFLYGGGFKFGSGGSAMYGADYLVEKDVVLVTINYRCGALGFLSLNTPEVPGNAGLKDMVQALKWVKENIHNFGGNSGNITIFGESAGGVAVSILTASTASKHLFNKAIIQSGTALNSWAFQKHPLDNARSLAKTLGCESEDVDDILEFLSATPVKDIVEATDKLFTRDLFFTKGHLAFGPVVEKEFPNAEAILTEAFIDVLTSGRVAEIPIMIGSNALEFTYDRWTDDLQAFIPEDLNIEVNSEDSIKIAEAIKHLYFKGPHTGVESLNEYFELLSDKLINIDTHRYVQYLIQVSNKPIYYYKFDYVGELNLSRKLLNSLGLQHAGHLDELGYLFHNQLQEDVEPTPQDVKMRERMLRLWTNFAKSGNPTPDENHFLTVTWQPVTKENLYYLRLGAELSLGTFPDKDKMDFWDALYRRHFKIWDHPKMNTEEVPRRQIELVTEEEPTDSPQPAASEQPEPTPVSVVEQPGEQPVEQPVGQPVATNGQAEVEVHDAKQTTETVVQNNIQPKRQMNGVAPSPRTTNEVKMAGGVTSSGGDVIRANDPPEDDRPRHVAVNKFVNFFESLGGKK